MIVKLYSGSFEQIKPEGGDIPLSLDRRALLVYAGNFESMDGFVEVKDEHIMGLAEKYNEAFASIARMGAGDVPLKMCPPVQLDHSTLAKDTVGRVYGPLEVGEHHADGKTVKALYGTVRILGKENVEKVMDGRWTNLSVGADFQDSKLKELTITPFPAAADASMLSRMAKKSEKYNGKTITVEPGPGVSWYVLVDDIKRGPFQREEDAWEAARQIVDSGILHKFSGGLKMLEKLKAFLMRTKKLSEKDAEEQAKHMSEDEKKKVEMAEAEHEKLKHYLVHHKKMSEADADKHLGDMNMEDHKKLAAEADEHEKKMAADNERGNDYPKDPEGEKKMAAARESLTKLSTGFRSNLASAHESMKKTKVLSRLSRLQAEAKITPAEYKKIDLVRLAKENESTIDAVLKSYEDREPVILPGMVGTKSGIDTSKVYGQIRMSKLEAETRANMPFLARATKDTVKLAAGKEEEPGHEAGEPSEEMAKHLEGVHKEAEKHMAKCAAAMDAGNHGEAKDHLRKLMEHYKSHMAKHLMDYRHMGEEPAHKAEAEMSALAESVQKMHNDFNEIIKLAGSIVGSDGK